MSPNQSGRPSFLRRALARVRALTFFTIFAVSLTTCGVSFLVLAALTSPQGQAVRVTDPAPVPLTSVLASIRAGDVAAATLEESTGQLTVEFGATRTGTGGTVVPHATQTLVPDAYLRDVIKSLEASGVPLSVTDADGDTTSSEATAGAVAAGSEASYASVGPHAGTPAAAESGTAHHPAGSPTSSAGGNDPSTAQRYAVVGTLLVVMGIIFFFIAAHDRRRTAAEQAAAEQASEKSSRPGRRATAGGTDAKSAPVPAEVPETRFSDVAGCDEAIADLTELVMFLKDPARFTRTGAKAPKGALLTGPPGTGKTLLARAVAGEAGVPFYSAAGSDFTEMYVGVGAKRVRELFAAAREHERAILFIDEIDAVARRRSAEATGGSGETENTLNALLTQMDGFAGSNVIVLAATNRPDILDPAITRPGRLDRKVEVPNPDRRGRERILAVHVAGKPVDEHVDLVALARRTPGFSGAQLAALVNEACLEAVRRDQDVVDHDCFDHAVATIAMGRARTSALVTDHDRTVTAWHEAGHTLAAYLQPDADDPVQVTIVPRGPAGGVTWMSGNDDIFLPRRKAHAQLVTALSGRAAEEILLDGEYTQGASGDLQSATELAMSMATRYGMTRLGYQARNPQSAASSQAVIEVVEELLTDAHASATALLGAHRDFLRRVAETLLDEETLTFEQVHAIAQECGASRHTDVVSPPPPPRPKAPAPAVDDTAAATPVPVRRPLVAAAASTVSGRVTALWARRRAGRAPQPDHEPAATA